MTHNHASHLPCCTHSTIQVGLPSRTFGGFFYDRALGRPVTLDIGFGPLKTRILGPTDEIIQKKKGEELVDMSSPLTLLIVTVSGTIRIIGTFAGVSNSKLLDGHCEIWQRKNNH